MRPYHWLLAPFFWWFSSDPDSFSTRNGPQMRIPISPRMQLLGNRKRSCLDLKGPAAQSRIGTHPICNRKSTQQEIMYSTESTEHVKILNSVSFFFLKGLDDVPSPKFFFVQSGHRFAITARLGPQEALSDRKIRVPWNHGTESHGELGIPPF